MRIVSWNCNGANARNFGALRALRPDVAVLSESCSAPPDIEHRSWTAVGEVAAHHLAVLGVTVDCAARPPREGEGRHTVAVDLPKDVGLLAIWSVPRRPSAYADEVMASIEAHADWLATGRVIVAGDLNLIAGPPSTRTGRAFDRVRARLSELGLESAYHLSTGVPYGGESHPTYYHRRKELEPFHIDFVFTPRTAKVHAALVGSYADYVATGLSDHVPVIVDVEI